MAKKTGRVSLTSILPPEEFLASAPDAPTAPGPAPTTALHVEHDEADATLHVERETFNIAVDLDDPAGQAAVLHVEQPPVGQLKELPVTSVAPGSAQPRQHFDQDELMELAASIKNFGVIQPIIVTPSEGPGDAPSWEIIAGERRWRAAVLAGLTSVPAIVRDVSHEDAPLVALLENVQRADLNPVEEATGYQAILRQSGMSQEDLGAFLGKSRAAIGHALALLKLPEPVQRRVAAGVISRGHAKCLVAIPDAHVAERLADRVVREGLTVRTLEEIVALGEYGDITPEDVAPRPTRRKRNSPAFDYDPVAQDLETWLDTKVHVRAQANGKGVVTVQFADPDDLWRILEILGRSPGTPDELAAS